VYFSPAKEVKACCLLAAPGNVLDAAVS